MKVDLGLEGGPGAVATGRPGLPQRVLPAWEGRSRRGEAPSRVANYHGI